jgi:hypothetical protein
MNTTAPDRQRLETNLAFWRTQADRIERDGRRLRMMLWIGPMLAAALFLVTHHGWASLAVLALAWTVYGMGTYMCTVRRDEYAFQVQAAETELATATQPDAAAAAGPIG